MPVSAQDAGAALPRGRTQSEQASAAKQPKQPKDVRKNPEEEEKVQYKGQIYVRIVQEDDDDKLTVVKDDIDVDLARIQSDALVPAPVTLRKGRKRVASNDQAGSSKRRGKTIASNIQDSNQPPSEFVALQAEEKKVFKENADLDKEEETPNSLLEELATQRATILEMLEAESEYEENYGVYGVDKTASSTKVTSRSARKGKSAKKKSSQKDPLKHSAPPTPSKEGASEATPITIDDRGSTERVLEAIQDLKSNILVTHQMQGDIIARLDAYKKAADKKLFRVQTVLELTRERAFRR